MDAVAPALTLIPIAASICWWAIGRVVPDEDGAAGTAAWVVLDEVDLP